MNKDLTVGNPQTVLLRFSLPLLGSVVFQQLYNIAAAYYRRVFRSSACIPWFIHTLASRRFL